MNVTERGERRVDVEKRIPEEIVEDIRLRTDILEVISEYVSLQRKGKNYLGLCPFHSEKTPSFTVTPDKQIFYCFGCHTGGNVFSFLMKKENWTFLETIKYLAQKHGISLPEKNLTPQEKEEKWQRQRWEEIHEWATDYFHEVLLNHPEGEPGREYFSRRGIDESLITAFRLGYAPNRWDGLLEALRSRGVKPQELVDAGLVLERAQAEGHYDRFRNRVMFCILDSRQRPVAFGGRVLDDSLPKYLNSPETALFSKGQHLYGMHKAHQGIRCAGFALLVEGYMDVLATSKAGFPNAVASLGTALTRNQARLLRKYTQRVVIAYDSDNAGIQATLRAAEILLDAGLRIEVLPIVGAKDPDEFLKVHGSEAFKVSLTQTQTYVEFKYRIISQEYPSTNILEKAELVAKLAPDILKVKSPVEREGYERFLSLQLGLSLETIQREIAVKDQIKSQKERQKEYSPSRRDISVKNRDNIIRYIEQAPEPVSVPQGVFRAERSILRLILEDVSLLPRIENELGINFCIVPGHQAILEQVKRLGNHDFLTMSSSLASSVQNDLAGLLAEEIDNNKPERLLVDCIQVILNTRGEEKVEELQARMAELEKSGDMVGAMALLREIGERLKRG
ncbi:MAG: DNA primase [Desulfitobacteriaceae bacterium]